MYDIIYVIVPYKVRVSVVPIAHFASSFTNCAPCPQASFFFALQNKNPALIIQNCLLMELSSFMTTEILGIFMNRINW